MAGRYKNGGVQGQVLVRLLQGFVNDTGILKKFLSFVYLSDYFFVRVLEGFVDYIILILKMFLSFVYLSDYFCVRVLLY